ncbi:Two-component response regulator SSK1p [Sorochytrium milnesiophthora]
MSPQSVSLQRVSQLLNVTALIQALLHAISIVSVISISLGVLDVAGLSLVPPCLSLFSLMVLVREIELSAGAPKHKASSSARWPLSGLLRSASKASRDGGMQVKRLLRYNHIQAALALVSAAIATHVPQHIFHIGGQHVNLLSVSTWLGMVYVQCAVAFLLSQPSSSATHSTAPAPGLASSALQCRHLIIPTEGSSAASQTSVSEKKQDAASTSAPNPASTSFISNFDKSLAEMANTVEQLRDATNSLTFLLKVVTTSETAWRASRLLQKSAVRNVEQCLCNFESIVKSLSRQVNTPKVEKFNLYEVVHRIADMYNRKLEECNVELVVNMAVDSPVDIVEACLEPLRRILITILSISISNTHPGSTVSISVSCTTDSERPEVRWATFQLHLTNVLSDSFFNLNQDDYFVSILKSADCRYSHLSTELEDGGSASFLEIVMPTRVVHKQDWRPFDQSLLHFCESLRGLDVMLYNIEGGTHDTQPMLTSTATSNLSQSPKSAHNQQQHELQNKAIASCPAVMFTFATVLSQWGVNISTTTLSVRDTMDNEIVPHSEHSVKSIQVSVVYGTWHELHRVYRRLIAQQTRLQPPCPGDVTRKPYQCLLFVPCASTVAQTSLELLADFDTVSGSMPGNVLVCIVLKPLSTYKITIALSHVVTRARELTKSMYHREMAMSSSAIGGMTAGNPVGSSSNHSTSAATVTGGSGAGTSASGSTTPGGSSSLGLIATPPQTPSAHFLQLAVQQNRIKSPLVEKSAFISDTDAALFSSHSAGHTSGSSDDDSKRSGDRRNTSKRASIKEDAALGHDLSTEQDGDAAPDSAAASNAVGSRRGSNAGILKTPAGGHSHGSPVPSALLDDKAVQAAAAAAGKLPIHPRLTRQLTSLASISPSSVSSGSPSPPPARPGLPSVSPSPLSNATTLGNPNAPEDAAAMLHWRGRPPAMAKSRSSPGPAEHAGILQAPVPRKPVSPPINVLIVEDNPINMSILTAFLRKRGIKHDIASDGIAAVNKFRSHAFHLVLMDLQLPLLDGIEATRQIRAYEKELQQTLESRRGSPLAIQTPSWATVSMPFPSPELNMSPAAPSAPQSRSSLSVPDANGSSSSAPSPSLGLPRRTKRTPAIIVALTASSSREDRREALKVGCNDFISKPINLKWLESKIIEWGSIQALIGFSE